jgi:hypothetical protein
MNKIKLIILLLLAPLTLALAAQPAAAFDLFPKDVCSGEAKDSPTCQQAGSEGGAGNRVTGPNQIINVAASVIALIAGVAAIIMIIISGLAMITSSGNSEAVTTARRRLVAAAIGLVIVVLAWALIRFVTDNIIK